MEVIPAINCFDLNCVKEKLLGVKKIGADIAHFDVSDGIFASVRSWNEPKFLNEISEAEGIYFEVHFMVKNTEKYFSDWLSGRLRRAIFHVEAMDRERLRAILELLPENADLGLALLPETPVMDVAPFLEEINLVQFLAVAPGKSGQIFDNRILGKVEELRRINKNVKIEVDGGINLQTARMVKEAGADAVVSASYIWESIDERGAYEDLISV